MNPSAEPTLLNPVQFYFYALIIREHGTKLEVGCCNFETPSRLRLVISNPIGDEGAVAVGEDPQAHRLVDPIPLCRGEIVQPLGHEEGVV